MAKPEFGQSSYSPLLAVGRAVGIITPVSLDSFQDQPAV